MAADQLHWQEVTLEAHGWDVSDALVDSMVQALEEEFGTAAALLSQAAELGCEANANIDQAPISPCYSAGSESGHHVVAVSPSRFHGVDLGVGVAQLQESG